MIINGYEQHEKLKSRMEREKYIYTPIFRDLYYHETENSLLCVGITFVNSDNYILSVSHDDSLPFNFTPNENSIESISLVAAHYEATGEYLSLESLYTNYIHDTHNTFGEMLDVNRVIPITIWGNIIKNYHQVLLPYINNHNNFTYNILKTLRKIERSGLAVNKELLGNRFGERTYRSFRDKLVYSQYNPFTATGRPSNRFGGINYSALNKNDGTREIFISRYDNGILVQLDFEAYHLRLLANYLGVDLPNTSIHMELAKLYFNTDVITDEMYEESKKRTFNLLYGLQTNTHGIELFDKVFQFRETFEGTTKVILPSGVEVDVGEKNSSKLFNYFVQSLEVVKTLPKLEKVFDVLEGTNNHLIMYTYDSILLDMESFDEEILQKIKNILEEGNYPVRIYSGKTYDKLSVIH
jgi:hypothetical protein